MIADSYLSVNTPVQNALAQWLKAKDIIQSQIISRIGENYRYLEAEYRRFTRRELPCVEGGWTAIIPLAPETDEEEWCIELLKGKNVYVHPGYLFDFKKISAVVVSLLIPHEVFKIGVGHIFDSF